MKTIAIAVMLLGACSFANRSLAQVHINIQVEERYSPEKQMDLVVPSFNCARNYNAKRRRVYLSERLYHVDCERSYRQELIERYCNRSRDRRAECCKHPW